MRSRPLLYRWLFLLSFSLLSAIALLACTSVPANPGETTPPLLTWTVTNQDTNAKQTFTGNASVTTVLGASYTITITAFDAGGIQQITLGSSREWDCSSNYSPAPPDRTHYGPVQDQTATQNVGLVNGKLLDSIFLPKFVTLDLASPGQVTSIDNHPWGCAPSLFDCGKITFVGTSTNAANLKAQASLNLIVDYNGRLCRSV